MAMSDYDIQEIEHTADWAIRVRARDMAELFAAAGRGMFGLLTDLSGVSVERRFEISLQAIDAETLLVDWLNELLFLAEERGLVFVDYVIDELTVNGNAHLRARAGGGRPSQLYKVIKAATFNGLSIREVDGELQAEIVFDV